MEAVLTTGSGGGRLLGDVSSDFAVALAEVGAGMGEGAEGGAADAEGMRVGFGVRDGVMFVHCTGAPVEGAAAGAPTSVGASCLAAGCSLTGVGDAPQVGGLQLVLLDVVGDAASSTAGLDPARAQPAGWTFPVTLGRLVESVAVGLSVSPLTSGN